VAAVGLGERSAGAFHRTASAGTGVSDGRCAAGVVSRRGRSFSGRRTQRLAWNYFFLPPKFHVHISSHEDFLLFGLYFVVAIVLGQLVARIRAQEQANASAKERATALYQ